MTSSGFYKYLAALFFITICICAASPAGAKDRGPSFELPTLPTNAFAIPSEFAAPGAAGPQDAHITSLDESLQDTAAIALYKHDDQIIWSLSPSLSNISLDPLENIKNLQVFLRYRW